MSSAMRIRKIIASFAAIGSLFGTGCSWLDKRPMTAAKADKPTTAEKAKPPADAVAVNKADKPTEQLAKPPVEAVASAKTGKGGRGQLDNVGKRLAAAASDAGVKFQFDLVYNPRPRTYHFPDGHVYVSSGMLEELKTADDLAAVLALEMAQLLAEKKAAGSEIAKTAAPATGAGDDFRLQALAAKESERAVRPEEVRLGAQSILEKAGYRSSNLAAVRERVNRFSARPETPTPRDPRLRQVFAN